jgi:hypothetical protein
VAQLRAAIEDAVISDPDVGGDLAATEDRAAFAELHGSVQANIRVHHGCPARDTEGRETPDDRSSGPWVIDGDVESGVGVEWGGIKCTKHRPALRRRSAKMVIQEAEKGVWLSGLQVRERCLPAVPSCTHDDHRLGHLWRAF